MFRFTALAVLCLVYRVAGQAVVAGLVSSSSGLSSLASSLYSSSSGLSSSSAGISSSALSSSAISALSSSSSLAAAVAVAATPSTSVVAAASTGSSSSSEYGPWTDPSYLIGTWSTKSNAVFTGPGFYDPVDELLIEPALPGISYSFTSDGWWEEAIYQITSNPQTPGCPSAALIFQHGTYDVLSNGSLSLSPVSVDGRQLLSEPCSDGGTSTYSRYTQDEFYQSFEVYVDLYHGQYALQLYKFDGSPYPPMYLAYKPPEMLPTETMNPTSSSSPTSASTRKKIRRALENRDKTNAVRQKADLTMLWYTGVALMVFGGAGWILL